MIVGVSAVAGGCTRRAASVRIRRTARKPKSRNVLAILTLDTERFRGHREEEMREFASAFFVGLAVCNPLTAVILLGAGILFEIEKLMDLGVAMMLLWGVVLTLGVGRHVYVKLMADYDRRCSESEK